MSFASSTAEYLWNHYLEQQAMWLGSHIRAESGVSWRLELFRRLQQMHTQTHTSSCSKIGALHCNPKSPRISRTEAPFRISQAVTPKRGICSDFALDLLERSVQLCNLLIHCILGCFLCGLAALGSLLLQLDLLPLEGLDLLAMPGEYLIAGLLWCRLTCRTGPPQVRAF